MRKIGLHIRLTESLTGVIEKAIRLDLPFFQTFLVLPLGKYIRLEDKDIKQFLELRKNNFNNLYLHGSYWINLCNPDYAGCEILEKEISIAKKLEFTHIVIHPGAVKGCTKLEGIEWLARCLNRIGKKQTNIKIILENTAHAKNSIGGNIEEFSILLNKLDKPDQLSFCIDTAHAYSFGYDISDYIDQNAFIDLLDKTIGINNIELIHLNDTCEELGSKIDKHYIPGKGNIGREALNYFLQHPKLKNIPVITELPILPEEKEKELIDKMNKWMED